MADQVYKVRDPSGNIREIRGPAGASDAEVIAQAQALFSKPQESDATAAGRRMNSSAQGAMTALQAPSMGFLDELAGAGAAVTGALANLTPWGDDKTMAENYRSARDKVRGANEQFSKDYPGTALTTGLAASAPAVVAAPVRAAATAAPVILSTGGKVLQAARTGAGYGAVSGLGESKANNVVDALLDAGKGAATGAATGSVLTGGGSAVGAAAGNVAQRLNRTSASNAAREKVVEALVRDARGTAFQVGRSNPINQAEARLSKLGPEATITDSGGRSTHALLDTIATLPGRTKDAVENLIHTRQAGRGARLVNAADDALGTGGRAYTATLDALDTAKKAAATPLYAKLENVSVRVDDELNSILKAAPEAHGVAEKLARLKGEQPVDLSNVKLEQYGLPAVAEVPFKALDKVKQALHELAESSKGEFGKPTAMSNAYNDLRLRLVKKMDALSPKDAGGSIYRQARDAYGSRAELESAVRAGRDALRSDAIGVAELTRGMSAGEREAFRIGALQSIKDKVGKEAGQTEILKMWKESATSGKLREIFGNDYRQFAAAVAAEARLKNLESVGRGSQTASRLYGAGDLDVSAVGDVGRVAAGVTQGRVADTLAAASNVWNRVKTPESVRDEIGRILMSRGAPAQRELGGMTDAVRRVTEERARRAAMAGAFGGLHLVQ